MPDSFDKQRRFPRIPSKNPVMVKTLGDDQVSRLSSTKVVGLGGCMFVNNHPFGVGTNLSLMILVQDQFVETNARVVYEKRKGKDQYEIGVEFTQISQDDLWLLRGIMEQQLPEGGEDPPKP